MNVLQKFIIFIWPPYEVYIANRFIDAELSICPKNRLESIQTSIRHSFPEIENTDKVESLAQAVYDSEERRKDTIEGKAQTFMFAFSICIGIVSILPTLFGNKWNIPAHTATLSVCFYVLAMLHLFVAIYHSIQARRISGFALPSSDGCLESIKENRVDELNVAVMYLSMAKFNEPVLTKKSNSLVVAETMFIRAVVFLVIASCISIGFKLYLVQG